MSISVLLCFIAFANTSDAGQTCELLEFPNLTSVLSSTYFSSVVAAVGG